MDTSINAHERLAPRVSKWVWFEDATALKEGQAVCYNWDYGTATDADGRRFNRVEDPTTLNAQYFAGVANRAYSAKTNGQFIEINAPGSVCNVWIADDTVKGVGVLTFDVTTGYVGQFRYAGLAGEGSARPMQTVTYAASTAELCLAKLQVGVPSGGVEVVDIVDNDAIGTLMIGGTTLVTGGALAGGHCTYTLADATEIGFRKKIGVITTEVTTNDLVVTVTTGRLYDAADTTLATVTWAGASTTIGTEITVDWNGAWNVQGLTKTMPALA